MNFFKNSLLKLALKTPPIYHKYYLRPKIKIECPEFERRLQNSLILWGVYIGETDRWIRTRLPEYQFYLRTGLLNKSGVTEHYPNTGQKVDNTSIPTRFPYFVHRKIR